MLHIGTIVKPQGVKGEVKIITVNPAERYSKIKKIFIDGEEKTVGKLSIRNGDIYIKLLGVDDRNAAELFRGKEVFVEELHLKPLKENEFYFKDLIGAVVCDEYNNTIGELIDIEQYGAADVIIIRERDALYSLPFINEIFIKIEPKLITVDRNQYDSIKMRG